MNGGIVMYVKGVRISNKIESDDFPYNLPVIKEIDTIEFKTNITFIIGENGSGKSTILEAIAALLQLNLEGGSANNMFVTKNTHSDLYNNCSLIRYPKYPKDKYFYRAESFYNLSTDLDTLGISPELFDSNLHELSRGEGFKILLKNRFFGNGIYLLDEPETGLSLQSQLEVLIEIHELAKNNSQFIIATHSPVLFMIPDADIYEITPTGIENKNLYDTEIMQHWQMLFDRKSDFIDMLIKE